VRKREPGDKREDLKKKSYVSTLREKTDNKPSNQPKRNPNTLASFGTQWSTQD
jgi:hypothetical protein